MVGSLANWQFDGTTEWLHPVDLFLASELLARAESLDGQRSVVEIGVWKGAWLLQLIASRPHVVGIGVDPYPGSPRMRQEVLDSGAAKGIADRTTPVPTHHHACAEACRGDSHRAYQLSYIEGLHVERQVERDLDHVARHDGPGVRRSRRLAVRRLLCSQGPQLRGGRRVTWR